MPLLSFLWGRKSGMAHLARGTPSPFFSTVGRPRRSTGSRRTARRSHISISSSRATWAVIWDFPIPGGPHTKRGWRVGTRFLRVAVS